jgi:ribonuclease P protein component
VLALSIPYRVGVKRAWRLKSEADVQRVWQQGGTWTHPLVVLRARANELGQSRVAFVASKKVGKAVARNRAKRLLRETTRRLYPQIVQGYDLVLIGRRAIVGAALPQIDAAVTELLKRAKLLK